MVVLVLFFFFKQKTAYEVRISDWSSDVCSSDLAGLEGGAIDDFLVPVAVRGVPEMLAKKAGIGEGAVADSLGATLGHAGAAHALVMLAAALESAQAGERILLASFGQGCDLLLFEVTAAIGSVKPRLGVSG